MKKYLFGLIAVVAAVAFSAFTTPKKVQAKSFTTYYLFEYQAPSSSFAEVDVENEDVAHWGHGTIVASPSSFTACDAINEKACQIIVTDAAVIPDGTEKRLRKSGDGGTEVTINADQFSTSGLYFVASSSLNVAGRSNQLQ